MTIINKVHASLVLLRLFAIFVSSILGSEVIISIDKNKKRKLIKYLLLGFFSTIPIYIFELTSEGALTLFIKELLDKDSVFLPHTYNKGLAILSIYIWLICYYLNKKQYRKYAFLLWFTSLCVLMLSDSLSARFAILSSSLAFLLLSFNFRIFSILVLPMFSLLTAIFFISIYYLPIAFLEEKAVFLKASSIHRLYIWDYVLTLIFDNPILGYGLNASRCFLDKKTYIPFFGQELHILPFHPHNNFLQLWFETGVMGVIIWLLVLIEIIRRIKKSSNKYMMALMVSMLTISSFAYGAWQTWWLVSLSIIFIIFKLKDSEINLKV